MIRVADIFCGAGGLSFGFANDSKFKIIFANDIDKSAAKSFKANHNECEVLNSDIADLDEKIVAKFGKIDLLLGGPPCQSYSTLGKRQMDRRANLFKEYLRILKILRPKMFIFENVVGLISMQKGELFRQICSDFASLGYAVTHKILNAASFGVPQIRERVILVGVSDGKGFNFPTPSHQNYLNLKDAIGDLPELKSGENGNHKGYKNPPNSDFLNFVRTSTILTEHISPKNNEKLIAIMQTLKDGQTKDDLPPHIRPKSGYTNTYAKMWWSAPAPTITRNFSTPSSSRCIHPRDSRALSIREGARLQSFPDSYIFLGSDTDKRLQIGNAVPPLLSIALAGAVKEYFEDKNV